MNPHKSMQAEEDEISLADILLLLQADFGMIVKSTLVCLLAGGAYYFAVPKMYEASVSIQMAKVAGESIEAPTVLLEKMKVPLFFSTVTLQACGIENELISQVKFFNKIKPSTNKYAPMVSFVTRAPSTQEAKACLNSAIAEVTNYQEAIAQPLLKQKKQKLQQLIEELKLTEENGKYLPPLRINNNLTDTQLTPNPSNMRLRKSNVADINNLRYQISFLENELISPNTHPVLLVSPVYSSEVPVNKLPLFTLGLCLALGVLLGILVNRCKRVLPEIRRQMRGDGGR